MRVLKLSSDYLSSVHIVLNELQWSVDIVEHIFLSGHGKSVFQLSLRVWADDENYNSKYDERWESLLQAESSS